MSNNIVVGVDFSAPSQAAAHWVARHLAGDAHLVLTHAVCLPQPPSFLRGLFPSTKEAIESTRRGAELRLQELSSALNARAVSVEVRVGRPDQILLKVAQEFAARLLVVGAHGERAGIGKLVGSTAQRVIRSAPTTVLLARDLPADGAHSIMLALDESNLAAMAVLWAAHLQSQLHAPVTVLHVANPAVYTGLMVAASASERRKVEDAMRHESEVWLRKQLKDTPLEGARVQLAFGDPGFEILAAAQRYQVDFTIMGRHGAQPGGGSFLGSVVEFMLRNGIGSVLVVNQSPD